MNHADIRDRLDQALASKDGVSLEFGSKHEALAFRMTVYALRRYLARQSRNLYPPEAPEYDRSPYDGLGVRLIQPATILLEHLRPIPPAEPLATPEPVCER